MPRSKSMPPLDVTSMRRRRDSWMNSVCLYLDGRNTSSIAFKPADMAAVAVSSSPRIHFSRPIG